MHNLNRHVERPLGAASSNEPKVVEQVCSTDRSKETSEQVRLSMEMAIEWAHLGGD